MLNTLDNIVSDLTLQNRNNSRIIFKTETNTADCHKQKFKPALLNFS